MFEDHISLKLCVVATLPIWLQGLMAVVACDASGDCEQAAMDAGYTSVLQHLDDINRRRISYNK